LGTNDISQEELNKLHEEDRGRVLFWWREAVFSKVQFLGWSQYSYDDEKNLAGEDDIAKYFGFCYIPELKHNPNKRIKESRVSRDIYGKVWYVSRED
jgi:hypothetical protein